MKTISPTSPLPAVTEAVSINGYTQPGASPNTLAQGNDAVLKVQLNGTSAVPDTDGPVILASGSVIKGLVINRVGGDGVVISGTEAMGNRVEGYFIGTSADGSADLGNTDDGVFISGSNNTVGGTESGAGNIISGDNDSGVVNLSGKGHSVLSNRIFANGALGIDLLADGVTNNDTRDLEPGANNLQNFSVITSARTTVLTTISGTINSGPNQSLTVQCFLGETHPLRHGHREIDHSLGVISGVAVSNFQRPEQGAYGCRPEFQPPGLRFHRLAF